MTSSSQQDPKDVVTIINYFSPEVDYEDLSAWKHRYLGTSDEHTREVIVQDIRGQEESFSLDENGFHFVTLPVKERSVENEEVIKSEYYPELENVIQHLTGASTVHIFNHVIRSASTPIDASTKPKDRSLAIPSGHPHVDYSGVQAHIAGTQAEIPLPKEIKKLYTSSSRWAYLGLWRPLKTIKRDPLAVCDSKTVPDEDFLIRGRKFGSGIESGNYILSHGGETYKRHGWWYMKCMQTNELVVFKGYDTL